MKYQIIISLYAIIILFAGINSQYIAAARNYDDILIYRLEDLQTGLSEPLLEVLTTKTFPDISKDITSITNIMATSTNANVDDSYCDMKSNFFIVSPEKLSMLFEFNYKIGDKASKRGELELSIFDLIIELKTIEEGAKPDSTVSIKLKEKDFVVYAEDKAALQTIFYEHKTSFSDKIIEAIKESINANILKRLTKKKAFTFTTNPLFGSKTVAINFKDFVGYCEDRKGLFESVVCYYSGNASDKVDRTLRDEGITDDFLTNINDKKVFINYKILPDILAKLNEKDRISILLDKNSKIASKLPYQFTVKSLKEIVSDTILQPFAETDEFTVNTYIEDISLSSLKSTVRMVSNINIQDKKEIVVIEVNAELKMTLTPDPSKPIFDLCFDKSIALIDIKVRTENSIKNLDLATNWIKETLLNTEQISISKDMFNMKDYFSGSFKNTNLSTNGIYLSGKSLF